MNHSASFPSTGINNVEMRRGKRLLSRMVVDVPFFLLLLFGGVNGLAPSRTSIRQPRAPNFRQQRYNSLTSLPLHYAIDSTRLDTIGEVSQNMTFPLLLSDDGHSIQSLITTTTKQKRSSVLTRVWGKITESMKFDRKEIAKMGIDFGLTYNMISNINGSITLSTAWYIASMKVR